MAPQSVISVGVATGSVVARGALWTCAWSCGPWWIALLSLGNGLLDPKTGQSLPLCGATEQKAFSLQRGGARREKLIFLHVSQVPDLSLCPSHGIFYDVRG